MNKLAILVSALFLPTLSPAQSFFDIARFQRITNSDFQFPERLIDGDLTMSAHFPTGRFLECEVSAITEHGDIPYVIGFAVVFVTGAQSNSFSYEGRLELEDHQTGQWYEYPTGVLRGVSPDWRGETLIPHPMQIDSFRITTDNASPSDLREIELLAIAGSRHLDRSAYTWRYATPQPGDPIALATTLRTEPGDDFAVLLGSFGSPLLVTPIGYYLWEGGLLLDPTGLIVLGTRVAGGAQSWIFAASTLYDPYFAGTDMHIQSVVFDQVVGGIPLMIWTNPVTFTL